MVNLQAEECMGCMACLRACPVNAIDIVKDKKDNDYAHVDTDKCIGCNKCDKVCPVITPVEFHSSRSIFAARSTSEGIVKATSSGGAAYLIAKKFIEEGGVVFGCKSTTLTKIEHVLVDKVGHLMSLRGSKYVKSDISKALSEIPQLLKTKKKVLFIGTPCQVAAVINFTRNDDNLYCIDLICHGVPSIGFFDRYSHEVLGCNFSSELQVEFRKKTPKIQFGTWFIDSRNGKAIKSQPYPKSPYMAAFFAGESYRENCHNCTYARKERVSDLTLGDFWGVKSTEFDDKEGVSLIMCNTNKGAIMFESIKGMIEYEPHTIEEATAHNANLKAPFKRPANKDYFYGLLNDHSIEYAVKKSIPTYRKANNIFFQIYLKIAVFLHKHLKNR